MTFILQLPFNPKKKISTRKTDKPKLKNYSLTKIKEHHNYTIPYNYYVVIIKNKLL